MRLTTAHDMSFQDLTNICLPSIAHAEVERYFTGGIQYNEISNLDKFLSNTNTRVSRDKLNNLLIKINDAEVFLVYSPIKMTLLDTLVSLKTNLEIEQDRKGLNVEHWQVHPQLSGIAKFNAELLIQRLTYHERVYGVSSIIRDKQTREHQWQQQQSQKAKRKSLDELSELINVAVPLTAGSQVNENKKLIIEFIGVSNETQNTTLSLRSKNGYFQSVDFIGSESKIHTFENLEATDSFSLISRNTENNETLFSEQSYANISRANSLRENTLDDQNVIYLLRHEIIDMTPKLVVAPQPPQFGVFFDGTNNNVYNALENPDDDDGPTNVAKLSKIYERNKLIDFIYVDGVGTKKGELNNDWDAAFAVSFGSRLQNAVNETKNYFKEYTNTKVVLIDVIGFSRGAAAARAFVNEVHRKMNDNADFLGGALPEFRFLGLFDTVGSVGLPGDNDNDNWLTRSGTQLGNVILDLHPSAVKKAVHLTAQNEHRHYFPLSSLKCKNKTLASNFVEESWPGAHSDIGGGYGGISQLIYFPRKEVDSDYHLLTQGEKNKLSQDYQYEIESKFANSGATLGRKITVKIEDNSGVTEGETGSVLIPIWERKVETGLENITLEKMHQYAMQSGVPLKSLSKLDNQDGNKINYEKYDAQLVNNSAYDDCEEEGRLTQERGLNYKVSEKLRKWVNAVLEQGRECFEYRLLYKKFIHHSHQYETARYDKTINPHKHEDHSGGSAGILNRKIFFNDLTRAIKPKIEYPNNINKTKVLV